MLTISRKFTNSPNLRHLVSLQRTVSSGRLPQFQSQDTLQNASNEEPIKGGYGEKEIILLGPVDIRTPLPGNMGIPTAFLFNRKDSFIHVPKAAGNKSDVVKSPLPPERYRNILTQVACVATENALSTHAMECNAYDCPELLKKDFSNLFPSRDVNSGDLTVITLCQKTENDMSEWSEDAELERTGLESCFLTAATAVCTQLNLYNYWADFIRPSSGKPNFDSLTNATMYETDSRYRHLGFTIEDLGCCKIIMHKVWGTHFFVGAIFTNAPVQSREVQNIINSQLSNSVFQDLF